MKLIFIWLINIELQLPTTLSCSSITVPLLVIEHGKSPQPYEALGPALPQNQEAENEIARLRYLLSNAMTQWREQYKSHFGFAVRFENDDTAAFRDAKHFQDMLRILGFPPVKEIVIEKIDTHPLWTWRTFLDGLILKIE